MQDTELLQEGLALMGLGMGFVFVFLTVLVVVTTLMSLIVRRLAPEPAPSAPDGPRPPATRQEDGELMAVIGAALHRHRQRHRR
ncbi:OadG family protein [Halomonas heilongjiangensis]|uniref:Probable oxaloacetate decarboxylase gamma chain n=1 Tax=Halomonas heilongjiangensis TaxID=1387883 RepID=A0A2N7TQV4_9GAMM|nr:OadG family transporter subunit [Halomonas heilongjiangensis]PMR70569.1 sodium pump decarboxylase subunit gamma [Halomonas heilongjiangensis]PXX91330.1 sodium pump decarboxylase subunit gamma [Halomonas heilongjiangensis]